MSTPHPYGYCPRCGMPGLFREKRPFGNDTCDAGHVYPSSSARNIPTTARPEISLDVLNQAFEHEFRILCPHKSLLKLSTGNHQYQDPNTSTAWEFYKRGHYFG